jgi:hypothetical protein
VIEATAVQNECVPLQTVVIKHTHTHTHKDAVLDAGDRLGWRNMSKSTKIRT